MKKLLTFALLAAGTTAMAQQTYTLQGTVQDADYVYFMTMKGQVKDSVKVENGTFHASPTAKTHELVTLGTKKRGQNVQFFGEGQVTVDLNDMTFTGTGSELNQLLLDAQNTLKPAMDAYQEAVKKVREQNATDLDKKAAEEAYNQVENLANQLIDSNKGNMVSALLQNQFGDLYSMDYQQLKDYLDQFPQDQDNELLSNAKRLMEAAQKHLKGMTFVDLEMPDKDGQNHRLSEWIGKGQYVLLDFWASWCGPCRKELPNVVENYRKYHPKGFEIVGISFDNKKDAWVKAEEQLGITWPDISDLKGWQSAGASAYGISSIPNNILFDPEGKIVTTGLRGEDFGRMMKEIYGE